MPACIPVFKPNPDDNEKVHLVSDEIPPRHRQISQKTFKLPTQCYVPIVSRLPSSPSNKSSTSTRSDPGTTQNEDRFDHEPLNWSNADLNYLLSILYPELVMKGRAIFTPTLEYLDSHQAPHHLELFAVLPSQPTFPEAYGRQALMDTVYPNSTLTYLLAKSDPTCTSATQARRTLAFSLLSDMTTINKIYVENAVLSALFSCAQHTLCSLKRGMEGMKLVSDQEWAGRGWQLVSVDEACDFESRFERFLLDAGREELDAWMAAADAGFKLCQEDREDWAKAYGKAQKFLQRACLE